MQLHINAHAADGIESHMRSPLVFHNPHLYRVPRLSTKFHDLQGLNNGG